MSRPGWLVEAAEATGYPVVLVDNWQGRGYSDGFDPAVVVMHHTAGPTGGGDMPSLGTVTYGRSDLPGPLCNYGLGRSGTIYVVADGKSNNAGSGSWGGFDSNYDTIGIEAENDGSQPWPAAQVDAYDRLAAECIRRLERDSGDVCSHAEWAEPPGRKYDPHGFDMADHRAAVAELIEGEIVTPEDIDKIAAAVVKQLNVDGVKLARSSFNEQTLYSSTLGLVGKSPALGSAGRQIADTAGIAEEAAEP
jgi:hypothetical protein